ncbi:MAG: hypothetical protein IJT12_08535 [Paludibacteraceae bacterium]|nr:hypothetical protein [Paludibacteraceae bacterium]
MLRYRLTVLLCVLCVSVRAQQVHTNRQAFDSLTALIEELDALYRRNGSSDSLDLRRAAVWRNYAYTAQRLGLTQQGQEYAQKAYEVYIRYEDYGRASLCLYERAIAYNNIGDTTHMNELLGELEHLAAKDTSALVQYNYYSILIARLLLPPPEPSDKDNHDPQREMIVQAGLRTIAALQRIDGYRHYNIMPAWTYYNHALVYDMLYAPPLTDSISHYLDLARDAAATEPQLIDRMEAQISIDDEQAWLYFYTKDYARAEHQMLGVLALLDSVTTDSPASIVTERGEAYAFMVELCQTQGRYAEALTYQQLLTDNNAERYSIERQRVLDEVQTGYEVEKKQLTIRHQRTVIRYLMLIGVLVLIGAAAGIAALWFRKRETEEELYAKALEAESIYNEVEQLRRAQYVEPLVMLRDGLTAQIKDPDTRQRVAQANLDAFRDMIAGAHELSMMDKRYLLCFHAGLSAEQIAAIFNITPASVYTVRYRIGKKNAHLKGIF